MSHPQSMPMATVFSALSDPTRLAIVERLMREGERSAGDLAEPFSLSKPAISKHLNALETAGILERRVERQWRYCRVRPDAIRAIDQWVERYRAFWDGSLDRLERFLVDEKDKQEDE